MITLSFIFPTNFRFHNLSSDHLRSPIHRLRARGPYQNVTG